jgi:hypothetical protein
MSQTQMPVLFGGHDSPMNAIVISKDPMQCGLLCRATR